MTEVVMGIVVKNADVLLVKRKKGEGNLIWQFPGGTLEAGETPQQAVVRELKEETGIESRVLQVIGERVHPYTHKEMAYIACEYISGELCVSDPDLEGAAWVKISELSEYFGGMPLFDAVAAYLKLQ